MHPAYGCTSGPFKVLLGLVGAQPFGQRFRATDLEQSLVVLVMGPAGIGAPAFGRLAVTEIQHVLLLRGASFS